MTQPADIKAHAQHALSLTAEWIERFGPRLAGSAACRQAAEAVQQTLAEICGTAHTETFETHPQAFLGFYQINTLIYLFGLGMVWLHQALPAALAFSFIELSALLEFGFYKEFYDWLFPRRTCANVWSSLEPRGKVLRQVIVSGHHDSAQELRILRRWQKLYALRVMAPTVFDGIAIVLTWSWTVASLVGTHVTYIPFLQWFLVAGLLFVIPKCFLASPHGTPGAGDNLIATAMLVQLAQMFADGQAAGQSWLAHTRLIFASFDAEESALRGSRAFAHRHRAELQATPTLALNIDSIYQAGELQFLTSDLNDFQPLDAQVAAECREIAQAAGYPARLARMRFGGGATDATELARAGVKATTMIAMSTQVVRDGLVYHTLNDTVDAIEPAAVQACLSVAYGFICRQDGVTVPRDFASSPIFEAG